MHFWIDKRSYGFGRARVSGSGFGQYPRRLRPHKPWPSSSHHRATPAAAATIHPNPPVEPTAADHQHHIVEIDTTDPTATPSYLKWSLWAVAICLSTIFVYLIGDKLYHEQLFTFCAFLAVFFILGVCTVSNLFRRRSDSQDAIPPAAVPHQPRTNDLHHHHQPQQHETSHHNHLQQETHHNHHPHSRHPHSESMQDRSISIHNLAESPTPIYHNSSHNQVGI